MPASPRYPFIAPVVEGAPQQAGVYALWDNDEVIYYGRALGSRTIRSALLEHLAGAVTPCTRRATDYSWEICRDPVQREAQLLRKFRERHSRAPRCNEA